MMKILEIKHWFTGQALKVSELHDSEPDPKVALKKIKNSLRKEFSHQSMSAHRMLDDILAGKQIGRKDAKQLQLIVLALEKTYKRAQDTGRQSDFDSKDTIDAILIRRLLCLVTPWSDKCGKKKLRWDPDLGGRSDDDDQIEKPFFKITFLDFLSFLKEKAQSAAWESAIMNRLQREQNLNQKIAAVCLDTIDEEKEENEEPEQWNQEDRENIAAANMTRNTKRNNNNYNNNNNNNKNNYSNSSNAGGAQRNSNANQRANPIPQRSPENKNNVNTPWRCVFECSRMSYHPVWKCADFLKLDETNRMIAVKKKGLCIGCLSDRHMLTSCNSTIAKCNCGGDHHRLLHKDEESAAS